MVKLIEPPPFPQPFLKSYLREPSQVCCFFQDEIACQKYYLFLRPLTLVHGSLLLPEGHRYCQHQQNRNARNIRSLRLGRLKEGNLEQIQAYSSPYAAPCRFRRLVLYLENGRLYPEAIQFLLSDHFLRFLQKAAACRGRCQEAACLLRQIPLSFLPASV